MKTGYQLLVHKIHVYIYFFVVFVSIIFLLSIILPTNLLPLPDMKWDPDLSRSRIECKIPGYCYNKKSHYVSNKILLDNGSIRSIAEYYNNEGWRGPDHPVKRRSLDTVRIGLYGTNRISGLWLREKDTIRAQMERILNATAFNMGLGLHFEVYNYANPYLFLPSMFRSFLYIGSNRNLDLAIFEYRGFSWYCSNDLYGKRRSLKNSRFLQSLDHPGLGRRLLSVFFAFKSLSFCLYDDEYCKLGNMVVSLAKKTHTQLAFVKILESGAPTISRLRSCLKDKDAFKFWDPDFSPDEAKKQQLWIEDEPNKNGAFYLAWFLADKVLSGAVDMEYLVRW